MKIKVLIPTFMLAFGLAFAAAALVSLLWKGVAHEVWAVDWGMAFLMAWVLAIVVSWMTWLNNRKKGR